MKKFLYLLLIMFAHTALFAQGSQINVMVQIMPPYSPYLSTYVDQPNKVLLTLVNNTPNAQSIKLWVKISSDNGVSVTTAAAFNPSQPIILTAFETKLISFSSDETHDYFDANNVDLTGITKAQLIQNQALPEGNYQICVRAIDYARNIPISLDGCTSFPISYIDPPAPIQPSCGTFVQPTSPQFILFSWTPPATAQGLINYEFTLKEVPNNLNPYDVIKMSIYPILFNTSQVSNNTLVYSTAFPQLEEGKKYVWQVKATADGMQFKNGGYSEPCTVVWGSQPVLLLTDGGNNVIVTDSNTNVNINLVLPANNSTVRCQIKVDLRTNI